MQGGLIDAAPIFSHKKTQSNQIKSFHVILLFSGLPRDHLSYFFYINEIYILKQNFKLKTFNQIFLFSFWCNIHQSDRLFIIRVHVQKDYSLSEFKYKVLF
jgi:hypothetical protein